MKLFAFLLIAVFISLEVSGQSPCGSNPIYRKFDFWIGDWEAFSLQGKKAGDSKISLILDSCIVLEEWTSSASSRGLRYAGKSFNTYNAAVEEWQQTWVDNVGGSTFYSKGQARTDTILFLTEPFNFNKDTMAIRRLGFYKKSKDIVRQHGEISKDKGKSWLTEYDLEYRRKRKD